MAQAKKNSLTGGASTKLQDFLSSDMMSLALPILAAYGAMRAPRTTGGALSGLQAFSALQEGKAAREERERKKVGRERLSDYIEKRATALEQPTQEYVPQIETEPGDEPVGLRPVDVPASASNLKLAELYRASTAAGKPGVALGVMGQLAIQKPKLTRHVDDLGDRLRITQMDEAGNVVSKKIEPKKPKPLNRLQKARAEVYERLGTYDPKQLTAELKAVNSAIETNEAMDIPDPERARTLRELQGVILRRMKEKNVKVPATETSGATTPLPTGGEAAKEWILKESGKWKPKEKSWFEKQLPGGTA